MTCPTCGSKLEVADEDLGHTVQCGSCQQTFTAEDPSRKRNDGAARDPDEDDRRPSPRRGDRDREDEDDRPRRSSRSRDDDEDDRPRRRSSRGRDRDDDPDGDYRPRRSRFRDEDEAYERRYGPAQQTGMGITSMILGILSIPTIFCYGFGIILGILAIIFGILSLKTAGRGMGIAGICTAIFAFLIFGGLILLYVIGAAARGGGGGGF